MCYFTTGLLTTLRDFYLYSAFASVQGHHIPPHRRITQEDTQSVVQTQAHPAAPPPMHALSHSVMPASGASFASLSGGQQTVRPKKRPRV